MIGKSYRQGRQRERERGYGVVVSCCCMGGLEGLIGRGGVVVAL